MSLRPKSKVLPGLVFALLLGFLGFVAGAFLGGAFLVPADSGLAGAAIVLGYGVIGLAVALAAGGLLARVLGYAQLRVALVVAGLLSLLVLGALVYRYATVHKERQQPPREVAAGARPPPTLVYCGSRFNVQGVWLLTLNVDPCT